MLADLPISTFDLILFSTAILLTICFVVFMMRIIGTVWRFGWSDAYALRSNRADANELTAITPQQEGGLKGAERKWKDRPAEWQKWQVDIEKYMSNHPEQGAYTKACGHVADKYDVHSGTVGKRTTNPRTTQTCGR